MNIFLSRVICRHSTLGCNVILDFILIAVIGESNDDKEYIKQDGKKETP